MGHFTKTRAVYLFLVFSLSAVLAFQNCGKKTHFTADSSKNGSNDAQSDDGDVSENHSCFFDGEEIADGEIVQGFQNSTVAKGEECVSEVRKCENGNLSGSFNYVHCDVEAPKSCLFAGRQIASGESVDAFLNLNSTVGENCVKETRTCEDGVLSGSFNFGTCRNTPASSCMFNGRTVEHNESVTGFQYSTVPFGSTCQSEMRACKNGILLGTYNFPSCTVGGPASCMFNGSAVAHGQTVTAFQNSSVPAGQACVSETRTCNNGVLSGSFNIASCAPAAPKSCTFNGQTIVHNQSIKAYPTSSVPYGQGCKSSIRTCNNGVLSGSGDFAGCTPEAPKTCLVNGRNVAHNESITLFKSSTVPFGQSCQGETRTCVNGVLGGSNSFIFGSCTPNAPASCLLDGQTIAHGQQVNAFAAKSVPFGQSCSPIARTCNNGVLSGSGSYIGCAPEAPKDCSAGGVTVLHGQSKNFFNTASVPFGQSCSSQARTCNNGVLSGTYGFGACTPDAPASCTFNGKTVAHGSSVTAYSAKSVPTGQSCSAFSESRTCSNGSLSGSAQYDGCTSTGVVASGVTVTFKCTLSSARSQSLVVMYGGTTKQWDFGRGEGITVPTFTFNFPTAPTSFAAYSDGVYSKNRYSNQTAHTTRFESEDATDNDYNDLICSMSW